MIRRIRFGILLAGFAAIGLLGSPLPDGADEAYLHLSIFTRAMEQIRLHYVDADRTSYASLIEGAMEGMMRTLDEHSQFLDSDAFAALQEDAAGEFGGLGIVVGLREGQLTVIAPMADTPASRAGLLPGDQIVEIDGSRTEDWSLGDAVARMRGKAGTEVQLRVLRAGLAEILTFTLQRAVIDMASIQDSRLLPDGIGYVRVVQFSEKTAELLEEKLAGLEKEGMRALVLDLRNNPGGLLQSAVEVSQLFLPSGSLVVTTEGRGQNSRAEFTARSRRAPRSYPMAILINSGSASASEIVCGALQDHGRAVLVGEKSFGKGSVQSVIPVDETSALRLTTARYLTPGRRPIHGYGIEPDIVVGLSPAELREIFQGGEAPPEPGLPSRTKPKDVQFERAADALRAVLLLKHRKG
ncbi:MAG: S41 family peptidase [Kiritimatiellia bacterium]|nr:S41 family peptidase [Kiritimatiellia bacterium]